MHYDLLLTAMMTSHIRGCLKTGKIVSFSDPPRLQEHHLIFECASHSFISKFRRAPITTVDAFLKYELSCGLTDVTLYRPQTGEEYHLYGFSNYGHVAMICRYKNGDAAAFVPKWCSPMQGGQPILRFTENHMVPYDIPKIIYDDNTDRFASVLEEITAFAQEIGFSWFAERYREARDILSGQKPCDPTLSLPFMSEKGRRLVSAANVADLFGGMGSWNDSPPCYAQKAGRESDYDRLSQALFDELRAAVLYAVNHTSIPSPKGENFHE